MKLAIVIAAYNEESSIKKVLEGLPKKLEGISQITPIVVNDGSKDGTVKVASLPGVKVLSHIINRGQGAALKTGFDYALQEGYDLVVTFDADGQHKPEEITDVIAPILANEVEVVLGSRFLNKKAVNISNMRKVILKSGVIFTHMLSRIKVTDTHNGFRAIHKDALNKMKLLQDKMEHASEILDQISLNKIPFKEVPVTIQYSEYSKQKGQKSGNALKIALKMVIHKVVH